MSEPNFFAFSVKILGSTFSSSICTYTIRQESADMSNTELRTDGWFLLVGIKFYSPGTIRPPKAANLSGCISDVTLFSTYLTRTRNFSPSQIIILTSSTSTSSPSTQTEPLEPPHLHPTAANIRKSFENVIENGKAGDNFVFYYSGHGWRVKTIYPEYKGKDDWDEALLPCDIRHGGGFVRDLELAWYMRRMTEKGLVVSVILDCCHSGGALSDDVTVGELRYDEEVEKPMIKLEGGKVLEGDEGKVESYTFTFEHETAADEDLEVTVVFRGIEGHITTSFRP